MAQVKNGDTIEVHYTGKLDDGSVFDTSLKREPLQFTIGEGKIIPGLEQAVVGMAPDESKTITIPMAEAYGPRREEMIVVVDRKQLPSHIETKVGQQLQINQPNGQKIVVTIIDVSESSVTLDGNHPLAGKDLIFDIKLVRIV